METPLVEFLQTKISEYIKDRKYQSLMTLSDRSGVPYNTVRRIANGKVDKPTLETVLAVLRVVETREGVIKSMKKYYPDLGDFLSQSQNACRTELMTDNLIDSVTRDPVSYRIFSLAGTKAGTTRTDINRLFGEHGIEKLNEMIENEIIIENDDRRIRTITTEYYSIDPAAILNKMKHCVECFDKSLIGTDAAFLATHTESLNIQGLRALKKAAKEFYFTVAKIKNDERYSGTIPFYSNILIGLLDSSKYNEEDPHV